MEARLQLRVQRYGWDAAAPLYDAGWQAALRPVQDTLMQLSALHPGEAVLETACGTGLVTRRIAEAVGPEGRVLATDLSGEMIDALAHNAAEAGIGNIRAERMNAEALDMPDGRYDAALCALGLMYVPDPDAALREMARAVRPGGRVACAVWGERRNCGWAEVFPIVDARVASEVCPMFFVTGAPGVLAQQFARAGLTNIVEERQHEVLHFASADALVEAVMMGGPVAMAVKRFAPELFAEVREEFLASVADYARPDGSYAVPGEFATVCGTRHD